MTPRLVFACMGVGLAALCAPVVMPEWTRDHVFEVYNPSDSVPRGWYRIGRLESAASLHVGSIVLARLPADMAAFAAQRGYLASGVPILKRVGALAPQSVCVREQVVRIDGAAVATVRTHDGVHRPLQAWSQCRPLARDELFLLGDTNLASFDSRYFGPVEIVAQATPKRDYYYQSRLGNRVFDLGLGPVALAFAGASTPEHQRDIDTVSASVPPSEFAAAWLRHAGLDWAADLIPSFPSFPLSPST